MERSLSSSILTTTILGGTKKLCRSFVPLFQPFLGGSKKYVGLISFVRTIFGGTKSMAFWLLLSQPFVRDQRSMSVWVCLSKPFFGDLKKYVKLISSIPIIFLAGVGWGGWGSKMYVGVFSSNPSDVGGTNFLLFLLPVLIPMVVWIHVFVQCWL